jgi:hypothetical protein
MIHVFNSSRPGERMLPKQELQILEMNLDKQNRPYILFKHPDYPQGALRAEFDGEYWACDLD